MYRRIASVVIVVTAVTLGTDSVVAVTTSREMCVAHNVVDGYLGLRTSPKLLDSNIKFTLSPGECGIFVTSTAKRESGFVLVTYQGVREWAREKWLVPKNNGSAPRLGRGPNGGVMDRPSVYHPALENNGANEWSYIQTSAVDDYDADVYVNYASIRGRTVTIQAVPSRHPTIDHVNIGMYIDCDSNGYYVEQIYIYYMSGTREHLTGRLAEGYVNNSWRVSIRHAVCTHTGIS